MSIAFFDLDETLIDFNSGGAWLKAELANGHISVRQFLRGGLGLLRYRLGAADLEVLLLDAIASQAGASAVDLETRSKRFYSKVVHGRWRKGALKALHEAVEREDACVVLTTASSYLAHEVCTNLGMDAALGTRVEVGDDGLLTGRVDGPLSFGKGKVELARAYAAGAGFQLHDCSFFTDSYSDRPMLEVVGMPVVVHPDRRLRRLAEKRGWPIEMW